MKPEKQTVYLPVKVEDEIPEWDGYYKTQEEGTSYLYCGNWFNNHLLEKPRYPIHWLKEKQAFVLTSEQLNEYTANVIKQTLETAAEKAEFKPKNKIECTTEELERGYTTTGQLAIIVDKQSITNTFEETYEKLKV